MSESFSVFLLHAHLFSHPSTPAPPPRGDCLPLLFGASLGAGSLTSWLSFSLRQVLCEFQEWGFLVFLFLLPMTAKLCLLPVVGFGWANFLALSPNRADLCLNFQPKTVSRFSPWGRGLLLVLPPEAMGFQVFKKDKKVFTPHPEEDEFCFYSSP